MTAICARTLFSRLAIIVALAAPTAAVADVIVGLPPDIGTGNCFPFGCDYNAEYQQVYASTDFAGPITISDLEFFNTQFNSGSTQLPSGTFSISLSTTSASPSTITGNFASNLGADNTTVFGGSVNQAWAFGDTLHIILTTPFTYDPGNGNLLMDVVGSNVATPGGATYFDVHSPGSLFTRVYCPCGIACNSGTVDAEGFDHRWSSGAGSFDPPRRSSCIASRCQTSAPELTSSGRNFLKGLQRCRPFQFAGCDSCRRSA